MWLISLGVTGALLALIFRRVETGRVMESVRDARVLPLLGALAVSFLTNCRLAAAKWRRILIPLGLEIPVREAFLIKMGSGPVKSVFPFRAGEASRVIYLKRRHKFSAARATGSILLELLMNILVFLTLILTGGLAWRNAPPGLAAVSGLLLAGTLAAIFGAGKAGRTGWFRPVLARIPGARLRGGLETLLNFHRFFTPKEIAIPLFQSLVIQGGKLLSFFLIASAFRITLPPPVYLVILPFSILIAGIPVAFLGIGLREGSLVELVPLYAPLPAAAVLAPALVFSAVEYLFPVLLGLGWTGQFTRRLLEGTRGEGKAAGV